MASWLNLGGINFGLLGGTFDIAVKAFSAPFFLNAEVEKINDINYGGKMLLPSSALDHLVRLNIQYPMLFKLTNNRTGRQTHCGVLEFIAEEGKAYIPQWIMNQLGVEEGQILQVESASLPKASYAKLKPQSVDFLQISNPRAVLEIELRKFACLSIDDRIAVRYNEQTLEFLVLELKPADSVCIIECDVNLEFDAPEGYVEPSSRPVKTIKPAAPVESEAAEAVAGAATSSFSPFQGSGARLDGKRISGPVGTTNTAAIEKKVMLAPIVVDESYQSGKISFVRYDYKSRVVMEKEMQEAEKKAHESKSEGTFKGSAAVLRNRK